MDYHNNFQLSMNYLIKYETYRILKLYAYVFLIFAVTSFAELNIHFLGNIVGISRFIFPSFLALPLVYCVILFFVLKSKTENYQFEISLKLIFAIVSILAIFVILPNLTMFLNVKEPITTFNGLEGSYLIYINRSLLSVAITLIVTFYVLRKFKSNSKNFIFLEFGILYCIGWLLETYFSSYYYTWLLFITSGVIFYLYSYVFLKRDLI